MKTVMLDAVTQQIYTEIRNTTFYQELLTKDVSCRRWYIWLRQKLSIATAIERRINMPDELRISYSLLDDLDDQTYVVLPATRAYCESLETATEPELFADLYVSYLVNTWTGHWERSYPATHFDLISTSEYHAFVTAQTRHIECTYMRVTSACNSIVDIFNEISAAEDFADCDCHD